jgi:hypothetical protein
MRKLKLDLSVVQFLMVHRRLVAFEVMAVVVKNVAIFWDITPCRPSQLLHFGLLLG